MSPTEHPPRYGGTRALEAQPGFPVALLVAARGLQAALALRGRAPASTLAQRAAFGMVPPAVLSLLIGDWLAAPFARGGAAPAGT